MNKLFIDNESYNIEEDNITISQIKRKIYVNGKLISETNKDSVHISFTGNVKSLTATHVILTETHLLYMVIVLKLKAMWEVP